MFYNFGLFESSEFEYIVSESSSEESEYEIINLEEIETKNKKLIEEKDIKFEIYPLYINWKKIESKSMYNPYYNIFKVFGYFGAAIYNLLLEAFPQSEYFFKCKNLLKELFNIYKKDYTKKEIEENIFFKKLMSIYDKVISLIKNKIIMFKEISIFLIILKLYKTFYLTVGDKEQLENVLKYQFMILNYISDNEYKKIYNMFYQKINSHGGRHLSKKKYKLPHNKKEFINQIKNIFKLNQKQKNKEK